MLEVARPETRAHVRSQSHSERLAWGIVDAILALLMLPFAIWMWLIEKMVNGISALQGR